MKMKFVIDRLILQLSLKNCQSWKFHSGHMRSQVLDGNIHILLENAQLANQIQGFILIRIPDC